MRDREKKKEDVAAKLEYKGLVANFFIFLFLHRGIR